MSGHHHHHHDHSHAGHAHGSGRTLMLAVLVTISFAVVEAIGGWLSGSLALLSDAGHMVTDASALAIGAAAAWLARRPASRRMSFGFQRAEVLGALLNTLLMGLVVVAVTVTALRRLAEPVPVAGVMVMVVAAIGLGVNLLVAAVLLRGEQTMNVRGALLHVLGDLLGSVAALAAGVIIHFTGWMPIDPLLSLFVAGLILVSAFRLLKEVLRVLMEAVPQDLDAVEVGAAMADIDGVQTVHDMHIWTLSSRERALAAHVDLHGLERWQEVLPRLQELLRQRFGITHTTLQPEDATLREACRVDPACGAPSR
jgi:cobalt-zinc-cadmium efflux system protein